jgi:hypothetical protein
VTRHHLIASIWNSAKVVDGVDAQTTKSGCFVLMLICWTSVRKRIPAINRDGSMESFGFKNARTTAFKDDSVFGLVFA